MGVMGLSHKIFLSPDTYLKTSLSGSVNELSSELNQLDLKNNLTPTRFSDIKYNNSEYTFGTFINHKFNSRHTNRTGVNIRSLNYDFDLNEAPVLGAPLLRISQDKGESYRLQAYTQSSFNLGEKFQFNPGIHFQYFALNKQTSIEPRLGLTWQVDARQLRD